MPINIEQLARGLADAWRSRSAIPLPAVGQGPATRAEVGKAKP